MYSVKDITGVPAVIKTHNNDQNAHGQAIEKHNSSSSAHAALFRLWQPAHIYKVGEVVYSPNLPSYAFAECIIAGTTIATEPTWPIVSQEVDDGTVRWRVRDIKSGTGEQIGSIKGWLAKAAPAGWLALDTGALLSRATYPDLWTWVQSNAPLLSEADWQAQAAVQTSVGAYSTGDGSTTFRLPRLLDYMRGGLTADVGKWQGDAIRNITGNIGGVSASADNSNKPTGAFYMGQPSGTHFAAGANIYVNWESFDASRVVPTADENRPKTIKVLYCVKAFDTETNQGLIDVTKLANDLNAYNTDIRSLITTSTSKVVSTQQVITWRGSLSDSGVVAGTWNPPAGYTREQCVAIASPASAVAQVNTVCASAETDGRVILRSGNTWTITYEVRVLVVAIK